MFSSKETSKMGKNAKHQQNRVVGARAGRKRNSTCSPINATILKKIKDIQSKVHAGGLGTKEINDEWFGNLPSLTSDQVSHLEQPF